MLNIPGQGIGVLCEVSNLCASAFNQSCCANNVAGCLNGVQRFVYTGTVTLPTGTSGNRCGNWVLSTSISARNTSSNLNGGTLFDYVTINDSMPGGNNSPLFYDNPIFYACANSSLMYSSTAIDPDGDSLAYELTAPLSSWGNPVPYMGGPFSATYPMNAVGPIVFDSTNGNLFVTPDGPQNPVVAIKITEYRNGVVVGTKVRDAMLFILSQGVCSTSSPNTSVSSAQGGIVNNNTITVCPGDTVAIDVVTTIDTGASVHAYLDSNLILPGMSLSNTISGNTYTSTISWPTPVNFQGSQFIALFTVAESCPVALKNIQEFRVVAGGNLPVGLPQDTIEYCRLPATINWNGAGILQPNPSGGIISTSGSSAVVSPTSWPMTYTISNACGVSDSVVLVEVGQIVYNLSPTQMACNGATARVCFDYDTSLYNYSFQWSTAGTITNYSTDSMCVDVLPNGNTWVYITISDNNLCTILDSVFISATGFDFAAFVSDSTCDDSTAYFLDASSRNPISWFWNFGDFNWYNNTSTLQNPGHKYFTPGYYTVQLVVTDTSLCVDTATGVAFIDDDCVWPGDANDDGIANNLDFLTIGLAFGSNQFNRGGASNSWSAQASTPWVAYFTWHYKQRETYRLRWQWNSFV